MNIDRISQTFAGKAAVAGGSLFAADGVLQLVHPQDTGSKVVGLAGHLNLAFFLLAAILIAPSFMVLARYARPGAAQKAGVAAAVGTSVLGLTCISSLVMGHDGVWFNAIAPLTNAAWLFGSIVLAVSLKRAGQAPAAVAIGLPLAWLATIPLASLGGGILTGAYFVAVGTLLGGGALRAETAPVA